MRNFIGHRRSAVVVLLAAAICGSAISRLQARDAQRAGNTQARTVLSRRLQDFSVRSNGGAASLDTRDLADAAYLTLLQDGDSGTAERYMRRLFDAQDMNAQSRSYGAVRWRTGDTAISDQNAVEFAAQALGPVLLRYGGKFSPDFDRIAAGHAAAAIGAIERHDVPVAYTNIYLMKCVNLLLLGQYVRESNVVAQARDLLSVWTQYTRRNGIAEFDSPTYYATDLDSLVSGYRYAESASDRQTFAAILRYFWSDIAANYFAGGHRISGPYSRDYDFVSGLGDLNAWIASTGWDATQTFEGIKNLQGAFLYDNLQPGGYRVPAGLRKLAFTTPRTVVSTWDTVPTHIRWNWIQRRISMGCANGSYGPQDKMFNTTFAGPATFPQISVVVSTDDAPYGLGTELTKSEHVSPQIGCAATPGASLVTLNLAPYAASESTGGLSTNIMLPLHADVALDGTPVHPGLQAIPVRMNDVISVAAGGASLALRIVHVDAVDNAAPQMQIMTDRTGTNRGVAWLRILHLQPGERTAQANLKVALLFIARDDDAVASAVSQARQAAIDDDQRAGLWTIAARMPRATLSVERSATSRGRLISLLADGQTLPRAPLAIDGQPLYLAEGRRPMKTISLSGAQLQDALAAQRGMRSGLGRRRQAERI